MTNRAITAAELAHHLGVSTTHIYRLARLPDFPAVRVGGMYRFWPDDVTDYLRDQKDHQKADLGHRVYELPVAQSRGFGQDELIQPDA